MGLLWKIYTLLPKRKEIGISEQKRIIDSFGMPGDDLDRVYYNYLANAEAESALKRVFLNTAGFFAVPVFIILYALNRLTLRPKENEKAVLVNAKNRVGKAYSYEDRIPDELYREFGTIKVLEYDSFPDFRTGVLSVPGFKLFLRFFIRHPLKGFINYRVLLNIGAFNRILLEYRPAALITYRAENNNTSSIITALCENNRAEYICFMHGEMFGNIQCAFVRFSRFYIWDGHYKEILSWGNSPADQCIVYTPGIYRKIEKKENPGFFITYYFSGSTKNNRDDNAEAVKKELKNFTDKGYRCKVRQHPRWSDEKQIEEVFTGTGIEIEDYRSVTVGESLADTEYVAGTYSSILTEAEHSGLSVILDDVTDKALFKELTGKNFIMLKKPHRLLSEFKKAFHC